MSCLSHTRRSAARGFSLVELMIVIVIIGILGGAVLYAVRSAPDKAKYARAAAEITSLADAIMIYEPLHGGHLPAALENLKELDNQKIATNDPWGKPYDYVPTPEGNFKIWSDGKLEGDESDDIFYTNQEGLVNKYAEKMEQETGK